MSTIVNGSKVMQAVLYTGTGATQTINCGFQPDLVWIKSRSAATDNKLTDSVRGATKALISNSTGAETTDSTGITAFTSTGFTLGSSSVYNNSGATYVAWCWNAGSGTSSSNTAGSITSTVSVNASAGFSVVTYSATGSNATVGHGLGVAPAMIIFKVRNQVDGWGVYHRSIGNTNVLTLDSTSAQQGPSSGYFNSTSPSSTVISLGTWSRLNNTGGTYVAYCWSEIDGYSKFGSYTGNGSTNGPFVYLGFRPAFIMFKLSSTPANWIIYDSKRSAYNFVGTELLPNSSAAEASYGDLLDFLSNGFKIKTSAGSINQSGGTMIYMAFAENPTK